MQGYKLFNCICALCLGLFLTNTACAQYRELKIISAKYRTAEQIVEAISPMLESGESLSAIDQHILFKSTPERIQEVERLIEVIDQPLKTFKVSVSSQQEESADEQEIAANGRVVIGNRSRSRVDANLSLNDGTRTVRNRSEQFLRVMDGQEAFIRAGVIVAFSQQWLDLRYRYPRLQSVVDYQEITSGFSVRPRTVGQQVELEITPRLMQENGRGVIDFKELSTVINVSLGEWVDIGGVMSQRDEISRAILSQRRTSEKATHALRVKIE